MTQTPKQQNTPQAAKPSASKMASEATHKAAKNTLAVVESTRSSAENVVKIGSKAVQDLMASSAEEAQKAQEKVFALGREGAENFAKSADAFNKAMYETADMSRDNIEACIECGNLGASFARDFSAEIFETANKAFSDSVEISKDFLACRTINDLFELQNRMMKSTIDNFFNQSVKVSGMLFEYSNEMLEPFNERMSNASDRFSKALSTK